MCQWLNQDESASEESELFTEEEELTEECGIDVEVAAGGGRGGGALWRTWVRFMARSHSAQ